jgi:adenine deaminase
MKVSANIVDILNSTIYPGTIVVRDGRVVHITRGSKNYDTFILPGFVDSHVHVESSMMVPSEFARLAVVHGTVAAVSDPHEIANVLGIEGVKYMIENAKAGPFKFYFGAPSCVPATTFETAGATIGPAELRALFNVGDVNYLGEMMNFPGVIGGDPEIEAKIRLARGLGKPIDGHAPGLRGQALKTYVNAGISTDHETVDCDEGREKISLGMKLLIREGSDAKNFDTLSSLIAEHPGMCMLCSDDKRPDDLVSGHINQLVIRAIRKGIDVMKALRCASVNPILHYGLDVGLLKPGDPADFIEVDNLKDLNVLKTYINGEIVAQQRKTLLPYSTARHINNFKTGTKKVEEFAVKAKGKGINLMEAVNHEIITGRAKASPKLVNGYAVSDVERDILKIVVVNRYQYFPPAIGFVKNFGLKHGAIASSVAHDSHNVIAVGMADEDICSAVNLVMEQKGGLAVVDGDLREILPLPIAGLMSDQEGYRVARRYSTMDRLAKELGSTLDAPFMMLSFMALLVIPKLKLSDRGLFDVEAFRFVDLFEDE